MGKVVGWNPTNQNLMPGDIMVTHCTGRAYRLYTNKQGMAYRGGVLSMREIKRDGMKARCRDGALVWVPESEYNPDDDKG